MKPLLKVHFEGTETIKKYLCHDKKEIPFLAAKKIWKNQPN